MEESFNPFAIVTMAHLKTQATRHDPESRLQWKWTLVRMLFERGFKKQDILELLRFIDWLMILPPDLAMRFDETFARYEEARKMRYVTTFERKGIEKGIEKGVLRNTRESIVELLEARFGPVPQPISEAINGIDDLTLLKALFRKAATIGTVEDFQQVMDQLSS